MAANQRLLRYLNHHRTLGTTYRFGKQDAGPPGLHELDLQAYCDADWGGDVITRKSTSGYVVTVGGGPVSWRSALQTSVALSSCEAEYYVLGDCVKEVLWLEALLTELGYSGNDLDPFLVNENNRAAIALAKNPEHHRRTKHVEIRHHFIRDHQLKGNISITYLPADEMTADGLTKALLPDKHRRFLELLGMVRASP